jgi:CRP-like cAMP-binding protein
MFTAASGQCANQLISQIPIRQQQLLMQHLTPVELNVGEPLCQAGQAFSHLYWPLTAVLSMVHVVPGQLPYEVALIGQEGMLGASLVLGVGWAPVSAIVQTRGLALQLAAELLPQLLLKVPALTILLSRYSLVLQVQQAMLTSCTHFHQLEPRLARWLLMTADRVQSDELVITHDFLAALLGVRRSSITVAAGHLRKLALINYHRGIVQLKNRVGLEQHACSCYSHLKDWYQFGIHNCKSMPVFI